jgi:hypothetical protein
MATSREESGNTDVRLEWALRWSTPIHPPDSRIASFSSHPFE